MENPTAMQEENALCALLGVSREKLHTIQKDAGMGRIDSMSRPAVGIPIADTVKIIGQNTIESSMVIYWRKVHKRGGGG